MTMAYWRIQLHPSEPREALRYTVRTLAANRIGLDFGLVPGPTPAADAVGDLLRVSPASLAEGQRAPPRLRHGGERAGWCSPSVNTGSASRPGIDRHERGTRG